MAYSGRLVVFLGLTLAAWLNLHAGLTCAEEDQPPAPAPAEAKKAPAAATGAAPPEGEKSQKYKLAFRFQPGQEVRYEIVNEMELTTHFHEATELSRNTSRTRRHYEVVERYDNGEADLELTIDWTHMIASFEDKDNPARKPVEFEFVSDNPKRQHAKFKHIRGTIGKPRARIRFSPAGQPLKVTPLDEVEIEPEKDKHKGSDASPESYLIPLPEKAVAVGDTWKERFDVTAREDKLPVRIAMQRVYKLAEVEGNLATITFRTMILTPVQNPAIAAQLMQREFSGKIVFDIEQGLLVSRDVGLDRTVVNPFGARSTVRAVSAYHERLLSGEEAAGRNEGPAGATTASAGQ